MIPENRKEIIGIVKTLRASKRATMRAIEILMAAGYKTADTYDEEDLQYYLREEIMLMDYHHWSYMTDEEVNKIRDAECTLLSLELGEDPESIIAIDPEMPRFGNEYHLKLIQDCIEMVYAEPIGARTISRLHLGCILSSMEYAVKEEIKKEKKE